MDQICPKRVILVQNRKIRHHHWILHIQISLSTKFQHKLIILIFWTKFASKKVFSVKMEKNEHHHCILHIHISISTNFQLKLSILDQIYPKSVSAGKYWSPGRPEDVPLQSPLKILFNHPRDILNWSPRDILLWRTRDVLKLRPGNVLI